MCRTALEKARAKAAATKTSVDFVRADVTRLSQEGIGSDFRLIIDNGCLHNMSDGDRDAYVREVGAVAAPDARLLIVAFLPGGRFGVRGVRPDEMERRFASGLDAGVDRRRAAARRSANACAVLPLPTPKPLKHSGFRGFGVD